MMKKRFFLALLSLVGALYLGGCSLVTKNYSYIEDGDSLYVMENGQIQMAMVEEFDKDYYDLAELTYLAEKQVEKFNHDNYGLDYYSYDQLTQDQKEVLLLPAALISSEKKEKNVSLVFRFGNGTTFAQFNEIDIRKKGGSMVYTSLLQNSSKKPDIPLVKAKGGDPVALADLEGKEGYYVVCIDYGTKIYFQHDVSFVSNNVKVLGSNSVQTPDGATSYIIFK